MCYLDDILIYSANEKEHEDHAWKVLQSLQEFGIYCKAEKCQFGVQEVGVLGFVINSDGIGMETDRISTIEDWATPESVCDVQVLLGITNFYQRFIWKYAKVTAPILNVLKTQGSWKWEWTRDAELAFQKPKNSFTEAPILQHFNLQRPIILQTDASSFAYAGIFDQYVGFGILCPGNLQSRICSPAK